MICVNPKALLPIITIIHMTKKIPKVIQNSPLIRLKEDFIGRLCDPVIVMAEGSVLFEGSVENAKKDQKVIESYLGRGSKLKDKN